MIEKGERWGMPPSLDIVCKDCKYKMPGIIPGIEIPRYIGGKCAKYNDKPKSILFEGGTCPRYEKE